MKQNQKTDQLAITLLIREILSQVDEVAALKKQGYPARISLMLLREMCSVLEELSDEQKDLYFTYLLPLTSNSSGSDNVKLTKESAELQEDVKRRFIRRIRAQLKVAVNE